MITIGKEKRVNELNRLLLDYFIGEMVQSVAETVIELGYYRQRHGVWVRDETYVGKNKDVFCCSLCGHWQGTSKKSNAIFYMNYCPFCGAEMSQDENNNRSDSIES